MRYLKPKLKYTAALALLAITALPHAALAITAEEKLGEDLYTDRYAVTKGPLITCEACHSLARGPLGWDWGWPESFVDEIAKPLGIGVSKGFLLNFGSRNAPSAGYAAMTPRFQQNAQGEYFGGQFWDGRVDTLAHQAEGPILNPVEMAMSSEWSVVSRLKQNSSYVSRFKSIYGDDLNSIPSNHGVGSNVVAPQAVRKVYKNLSTAIAKFEQTPRFNKFSSKYDFYLAGQAQLSSSEKRGLALFNGKANCSTCHTSKMQKDVNGNAFPPMFTDYKYYNVGTPPTSGIGAMSQPDVGLAGNAQVMADGRANQETGKFKVPSLRNVQNTGLYMHNGSFKKLKDVIHFFNTRDTLVERGNVLSWGFASWQWPAPETRENEVTGIIGNLGLSGRDERDIESFLKTLTDNYQGRKTSPWTNAGQELIKKNDADIKAATKNLAIFGTAEQSSTHRTGASASRAIDQDTNGEWSGSSVTHTKSDSMPWWQVDLGKSATIEQINLFNRTDCCTKRLADGIVFVSDKPFGNNTLWSLLSDISVSKFEFEGALSAETEFSINKRGRYVRVQLYGKGYLSLAEVQVMGR